MSATEAAVWLRVSEETLRAWVNAGDIGYVDLRQTPGTEPGPGVSFTLEDLESFVRMRGRRVKSRSGKATFAKIEFK